MPEMLLAALALACALAALGTILLFYRRQRSMLERIDELSAQLGLQQQSTGGLTSGALGVDRRLRALEDAEQRLAERQDSMELQRRADQPYGEAIRLVQQGATTTRLVEELGISETEADLIVRLHGERASA